jgi:hypothetical protein
MTGPDAGQLAAAAQLAAETYYAVATADGPEARYDSEAYRAARDAFIAAVRAAYQLTAGQAMRAYDYLTEYGPHDSLTWGLAGPAGQLHGVASYAARVRLDLAEERAARIRDARQREASRRRQAWYDTRHVADLAGVLRYTSDVVTWRMVAALVARRAGAEPLGAAR